MRNYLLKILAVGSLLVSAPSAWAQLDNRAFTSATPGEKPAFTFQPQAAADTGTAGELRLSVRSFTFFKDNEYFNRIIEGYTLFGTQLNPQLVYYPMDNLRLEGGVFLWKDFGTARLRQVRPTFRATYTKGRSEFVLGNIRPNLSHGYIEPLFDFERALVRPLEEGLQYRYISSRVGLDVWVDWQRQQYRYSNYQEEIAGGLSGSVRLTGDNSPVAVSLPVQFTATHRGGQIDTINRPLQTLLNGATGLEARYPLPTHPTTAFRVQAYATGYYDKSFSYQLPYRRGAGLYLNATAETRYLNVMLSYWQGQQFLAPLGGDLYQSASRSVVDPAYTEPHRRIMLLRLMRNFSLGEAAALTVRVEPIHDFKEKQTDFSAGIYLNFRQEWLLGHLGRRVRVGSGN